MGKVLHFPRLSTRDCGVIHVWARPDGQYEVAHESRSGSSWGNFASFDTAQEAVATAYRLNRAEYAGTCDVSIRSEVIAALPETPAPAWGEW